MEPNTDDQIEGQRIVAIRGMTDAELVREDWSVRHGDSPPVIELESGIVLYPSMDPEGNGPGALFGIKPDNEAFFLSPDLENQT
jgi:hypothetical protein